VPEYEALIMVKDDGYDEGYREGDIVVVRPKGWSWGKLEVKEFLIMPIEVTDEEAKMMETSVEIEYEENVDVDEVMLGPDLRASTKLSRREIEEKDVRVDMVIKRRFHIDFNSILKQLSAEERELLRDRGVEFQPSRHKKVKPIDKLQAPLMRQKLDNKINSIQRLGYKGVQWQQK
jgi:cellobiose-specific phosphotransferase system component IIB